MTRIESGELSRESFVGEVAKMVGEIVKEPLAVPESLDLPRKKTQENVIEADCPLNCGKKARRFGGKYGPFWKCPVCNNFFNDENEQPVIQTKKLSVQ